MLSYKPFFLQICSYSYIGSRVKLIHLFKYIQANYSITTFGKGSHSVPCSNMYRYRSTFFMLTFEHKSKYQCKAAENNETVLYNLLNTNCTGDLCSGLQPTSKKRRNKQTKKVKLYFCKLQKA